MSKPSKFVDSFNRFCWRLLDELFQEDALKNIFFSSFSVGIVMHMLYQGANGRTSDELVDLLCLDDDQKEDKVQLCKEIEKLMKNVRQLANDSILFESGNAMLVNPDTTIRESYRKTLRESFDAEEFSFEKSMPETVKKVNSWVDKKTKSKIPQLLDELSPNTKMLLLNAVYFKGDWLTEFDPSKTSNGTFYDPENNRQFPDVPFMKGKPKVKVVTSTSPALTMLELPYKSDSVSMFLVMPQDFPRAPQNFPEIIEHLRNNWSSSIYPQFLSKTKFQHDVYVPKFKLETRYNLVKTFKKMNVSTMFGSEAELDGITPNAELYVSQIIHSANIEVNEKGSEVAAATVAVMLKKGGSMPICFNRSFIFMICDNHSRQILFTGLINQL